MDRKGEELPLEQKSRIAAHFLTQDTKNRHCYVDRDYTKNRLQSLRYKERGDLENKRRSGRRTEFI